MIKVYSYGKINLFLDIEKKLSNNYHSIKTVMQSIELHDEVILEEIKNEIIVKCSNDKIPVDEKNTCYKAAAILKEKFHINSGVLISINKNIPSEAGLAGGSSNAAAVIKGLNKLWNLNLTDDEMLQIGLMIGADVPFCLTGGTFLAQGVGEKLTKLNDFVCESILIVKPSFSMSTAFVYNNLTPEYYNLYDQNKILSYIKSNDFLNTAFSTANTLEKVVEKFHPELNEIKRLILNNNAISSIMSGSGSAVFGLFKDKDSLELAHKKISKIYPESFKTKTINKGIMLV